MIWYFLVDHIQYKCIFLIQLNKLKSILLFAGDLGEELHTQPAKEGLAEGALQPREVARGAEWQEDGAAGRRDLGRNLTGRVGQMTD